MSEEQKDITKSRQQQIYEKGKFEKTPPIGPPSSGGGGTGGAIRGGGGSGINTPRVGGGGGGLRIFNPARLPYD